MKKLFGLVFILAGLVCVMVSCSGGAKPAGEEAPLTVNTQFLALPGKPLGSVLDVYPALREQEHMIHEVGSLCAAIEYYTPDLLIYFDPFNLFNLSGLPQNEYKGDIFTDENLRIYTINLLGEFDAANRHVIGQQSLKQLFVTEGVITYAQLCNVLEQKPVLDIIQNGTWEDITPNQVGTITHAINGDCFRAQFLIEATPVNVGFVKKGNEYIAYAASFGEWVNQE